MPVEGCTVRVEPVGPADRIAQLKHFIALEKSERGSTERALRLSEPVGGFGGVRVSVQVETTAKTGVEMEALTGVVGAALTVVDMCKGVDRGCVVEGVEVVGKEGRGEYGEWKEWSGVET